MSIEALTAPLSRQPLFHGLDAGALLEIARAAERVIYKPGDFIIEDGQAADAAILVVTGKCVRISGPERSQRAEEVQSGSLIAEMAMLVDTVHTSTVIARSPVRALRLLRADILDAMAKDSSIADHFLRIVAKRLHALAEELRGIDRILSEDPATPLLAAPLAGAAAAENRVH